MLASLEIARAHIRALERDAQLARVRHANRRRARLFRRRSH